MPQLAHDLTDFAMGWTFAGRMWGVDWPLQSFFAEHLFMALQHPHLTKPAGALALSLGLGFVLVTLFFHQPTGINAPLFVAILTVGTAIFSRMSGSPLRAPGYAAFAAAFVFACFLAIRDSEMLFLINVGAVLSLLLYGCYFGRSSWQDIQQQHLFKLGAIVPFAAIQTTWGASTVVRDVVKGPKVWDTQSLRAVLRGLVLALPVIVVFGALLISADASFSAAVSGLLDGETVARLCATVFFAWFIAGGLLLLLQREEASGVALAHVMTNDDRQGFSNFRMPKLGFIETTILLGSVALLFVVFLTMQGEYLFGGYKNIKDTDVTLSAYARRGFFELIMVAGLALALAMILREAAELASRQQQRVFKALVVVVMLCTGALLLSAQSRMEMYQFYYGVTELRFYPSIFMIWLGVVMVWFVLGVLLNRSRIAYGFVIAVFGLALHLNLLNPDAQIVRQNFAEFVGKGDKVVDFDINYLVGLSADALPALMHISSELNEAQRALVMRRCDEYMRTRDARRRTFQGLHWAYNDRCSEKWMSMRP